MPVAATVIEAPFPSISSVSETGSRVFERIEGSLREVAGVVEETIEGIEGVVEGAAEIAETGMKALSVFDWISPTLGVLRVLGGGDGRLVFSGIGDGRDANEVLREVGIKPTGKHYDPLSGEAMLTVRKADFSEAGEALDNFFGFS